jgi:lipopolysaccharide transport system permease protein
MVGPVSPVTLLEAGRRPLALRPFLALVRDLTARELAATHRFTLLGWGWPVARQLAQLAVLVFIFSTVFDLGVENFAVFVFCGLIAWSWFSSGILAASSSLLAQRHLVFQPRLPNVVIPVVAVTVPVVDVVFALPVLVVMLVASTGLRIEILLCPALLMIQYVLMLGIAWLCASISVFFRDVPNLVSVAMTILFYLTPVFYGLRSVPDEYEWVLQLNPMTTIIEGLRSLTLDQAGPAPEAVLVVAVVSAAVAALGFAVFQRLESRFVDVL